MSMFSLNDIEPKECDLPVALVTEGKSLFRIGRACKVLKEVIGTIEKEKTIHVVTNGQWNSYELFEYILYRTGPAKVFMSTWAITEQPMRALMHLKDSGYIRELNCIFDERIGKQNPRAFQFVQQLVDNLKLAKCHAKVSVIMNEDWAVTVMGSANWTKNPRMEAGVICSERAVGEFYSGWIWKTINGENGFN